MIKGPDVDEIVKRIVLAHADGDIIGIAIVLINAKNQPELEISFGAGQIFTMNIGLDLLKMNLLNKLMADGTIPPKERE